MKVGASIFCQNFYRTQVPDPDIYREDLALADLAEPLGFDSIWAVEHHFSPYTMIPDVTQFLSYLCGRTKRIGLATMVIVLPWHDPVRVAEEIAMLDLFARDRELTLGFGRGSGRIEYEGLRIPMGESRERFAEAAEVVKLALTQERFSFNGQFYKVPEMTIRPRPLHKNLTDRFFGAIVSPETGDIMARAGMGMLIIPQKPWSEHAKDYQAYLGSCRKFGQKGRRPIAVTCRRGTSRSCASRWTPSPTSSGPAPACASSSAPPVATARRGSSTRSTRAVRSPTPWRWAASRRRRWPSTWCRAWCPVPGSRPAGPCGASRAGPTCP